MAMHCSKMLSGLGLCLDTDQDLKITLCRAVEESQSTGEFMHSCSCCSLCQLQHRSFSKYGGMQGPRTGFMGQWAKGRFQMVLFTVGEPLHTRRLQVHSQLQGLLLHNYRCSCFCFAIAFCTCNAHITGSAIGCNGTVQHSDSILTVPRTVLTITLSQIAAACHCNCKCVPSPS